MDKNDLAQNLLKKYKNKTDLVYEIGIISFKMSEKSTKLRQSLSLNQLKIFHELEQTYIDYLDALLKDVFDFAIDKLTKKSTK